MTRHHPKHPDPARFPAPGEWDSREDAPGVWRVYRHGTAYGAGPWTTKAAADDALGYFAWVAAGGSAD